jgi:hypothetical protein
MYASGVRFAVMGTAGTNAGQHVFRIPQMTKGVFQHNRLQGAGADQHQLKLHAPCRSGTGCDVLPAEGNAFTEHVVISDNRFVGGSSAWLASLGPQNNDSDERLRDIIIERNWFSAGAGTSTHLLLHGVRMTARNNIMDLTGSTTGDYFGIHVGRRGQEPTPADVAIYNNTIFRSGGGAGFEAIDVSSSSNTQVKNNLAYAPGASSPVVVGAGGSGTVVANNSPSATAAPGFVGGSTPSAPADFDLTAASISLSSGTTVPVFSDFFRRNRPLSGGYDRGAAERP